MDKNEIKEAFEKMGNTKPSSFRPGEHRRIAVKVMDLRRKMF